jgi:hypothetical protein
MLSLSGTPYPCTVDRAVNAWRDIWNRGKAIAPMAAKLVPVKVDQNVIGATSARARVTMSGSELPLTRIVKGTTERVCRRVAGIPLERITLSTRAGPTSELCCRLLLASGCNGLAVLPCLRWVTRAIDICRQLERSFFWPMNTISAKLLNAIDVAIPMTVHLGSSWPLCVIYGSGSASGSMQCLTTPIIHQFVSDVTAPSVGHFPSAAGSDRLADSDIRCLRNFNAFSIQVACQEAWYPSQETWLEPQ